MCKAPKPPPVEKTPPPEYMTNEYTDNLFGDNAKRLKVGRNAFRIDRSTSIEATAPADAHVGIAPPQQQLPAPRSYANQVKRVRRGPQA